MQITDANRNTWLALYTAAEQFKQLAPWRWIYDGDLFGVEDPLSGEVAWCFIMGRGGEVFALAAYKGNEGYVSYQRILETSMDEDSTHIDKSISGLEQEMLKVEFVNRNEMNEQDLAHLKALGLKFHGANQWVQLRDMVPGLYPWHISDEQAAFLTLVLQQAMDVAPRFRDDRQLLHPKQGKMLVRRPLKTANGITWEDCYVDAPLVKDREPLSVASQLVQKAKKQLPKKEAALCFSISYMHTTVRSEEKGAAPYFPLLGLWMAYGSGYLYSPTIFKRADLEATFEAKFFKQLHSIGILPLQLVVNSDFVFGLVEPFTKALGIELIYAPREAVFEEVTEFMRRFGH